MKKNKRVKKFNSKQNKSQTFNSISTNKSWKKFIQIEKENQTNTISFASTQ